MSHALLNLKHRIDVLRHPTVGASWEWFAMAEIKRATALRITASMRIALADFGRVRLEVIYAGEGTLPMGSNLRAVLRMKARSDIKPIG